MDAMDSSKVLVLQLSYRTKALLRMGSPFPQMSPKTSAHVLKKEASTSC